MNENIRKLIEQCRWQEILVEDGEEWIHAHFDEAKFAYLIIQECINACGEDYGAQLIHQHWYKES
jgi:hypothetical protein